MNATEKKLHAAFLAGVCAGCGASPDAVAPAHIEAMARDYLATVAPKRRTKAKSTPKGSPGARARAIAIREADTAAKLENVAARTMAICAREENKVKTAQSNGAVRFFYLPPVLDDRGLEMASSVKYRGEQEREQLGAAKKLVKLGMTAENITFESAEEHAARMASCG